MKNGIHYLVHKGIPAAIIFAVVVSVGNIPDTITPEALGEQLFFDDILSKDRSVSCASCHKPAYGFADTVAFSLGIHGQRTDRNTPTITNMLARTAFFWDGRATTLEHQALIPIQNPKEMGLPVWEAVQRLRNDTLYKRLFKEVFDQIPNPDNLGYAIAAFERTLETSDTEWDLLPVDQLSKEVLQGKRIFDTKGKCIQCHFTPDFTADEFKNVGLYNGKNLNDPGRFNVTGDNADVGKFKTPGLRNVAVTAPYMHNGMFKTLREVIDYYDNPTAVVPDAINTDTLLLQPLGLTETEKSNLEAFLKSLTDKRFLATGR